MRKPFSSDIGRVMFATLSSSSHSESGTGSFSISSSPRPSSSASLTTPLKLGRGEELIENEPVPLDRKSTRLNSSHVRISYSVFCLKKNKEPVSRAHRDFDHPGPCRRAPERRSSPPARPLTPSSDPC